MSKERNILIVDDTRFSRKMLKTIIENKPKHIVFKYNAIEACNGEEALDVISKNNIDTILLDINMPVLDGYEVLKSLKESKKEIAVIVITGDSNLTVNEFDGLEIRNIYYKPFPSEVLWDDIAEITEELLWKSSYENVEKKAFKKNELSEDKTVELTQKKTINNSDVKVEVKEEVAKKVIQKNNSVSPSITKIENKVVNKVEEDSRKITENNKIESRPKEIAQEKHNNKEVINEKKYEKNNEPKNQKIQLREEKAPVKQSDLNEVKRDNNLSKIPNLNSIRNLKEKINEQKKDESKVPSEPEPQSQKVNPSAKINENIEKKPAQNQTKTKEPIKKAEAVQPKKNNDKVVANDLPVVNNPKVEAEAVHELNKTKGHLERKENLNDEYLNSNEDVELEKKLNYEKLSIENEIELDIEDEVINEIELDIEEEISDEIELDIEDEVIDEIELDIEDEVIDEIELDIEEEISDEIELDIEEEFSDNDELEIEDEIEIEIDDEISLVNEENSKKNSQRKVNNINSLKSKVNNVSLEDLKKGVDQRFLRDIANLPSENEDYIAELDDDKVISSLREAKINKNETIREELQEKKVLSKNDIYSQEMSIGLKSNKKNSDDDIFFEFGNEEDIVEEVIDVDVDYSDDEVEILPMLGKEEAPVEVEDDKQKKKGLIRRFR